MSLGDHLREIRERKGWTQNHLAEVSGVPQPSIWRLENGVIRNPKSGLLRKLSEALEVSMDYLIDEDKSPSFDELLRDDPTGQAVFRDYEKLQEDGRQQARSFLQWLTEMQEKKRQQGDV